jgi:WD40 repeat protein
MAQRKVEGRSVASTLEGALPLRGVLMELTSLCPDNPFCRAAVVAAGVSLAVLFSAGPAASKDPLVLEGLKGNAYHLEFSPDGKLVAVSDWAATVRVWDLATGKEVTSVTTGRVGTVAFSPDGQLLAAPFQDGQKLGVRLWDLQGRLKGEIPAPRPGGAARPIFTPDGKLLVFAVDAGVMVWDLAANKEADTLERVPGVSLLGMSPDGKYLAGGGPRGKLAAWDLPNRKLLWSGDSGATKAVESLDFSPDGKLLAVGNGWDDLVVCDVESGKGKTWPRPVEDEGGVSRFVAFAPDGKTLYTAPASIDVYAWDVERASVATTLKTTTAITALALSPDGKLLAVAGYDKTVRVYEAPAARKKDK